MRLTLFCRHSDLVRHMEEEVRWLKEQLIHERRRAEDAINRLLSGQGVAPVSVTPTPPSPLEAEMERLLQHPEFARAGEVDAP